MARWPRTDRPRSRALAFPLAAALLFAAAADADADADADAGSGEISFSRHSEVVARRDLDWLRHVAPPSLVTVREPYESGQATFRALPFDRVLDAVYTPSWRKEEELLFTCRDGYEPSVPVARFLTHRAWLAFERVDQPTFTVGKLESGRRIRVDLSPYYLIWENLDDAQMLQEADYGWPYQVVGVDLIRRSDHFPKMTPPAGSSPEVLAGFAAFRVHCSKCHKLNGEGGEIGPELNAAGSPLDTRDTKWLRSWIEDPSRISPGARMPPLNPALPDRARTVDEILAYLKAMRSARAPEDEPGGGPGGR